MGSAIERAARALCALDGHDPDEPHRAGFQTGVTADPVPAPPLWHAYVPRVRAVLTAIREPSERMINEAYANYGANNDSMRKVWGHMIDALLEEER